MEIKTIATVNGINLVDFGDCASRFYWFRNLGDSTLYVSAKPNPIAGGDDVSELPPKSSTSIETDTGKIYILGAGKVEIHNTDSKFCPFKGVIVVSGGGGGEIVGYVEDGLILFSELTDKLAYNPIADDKLGRIVNDCNGAIGYASATKTDIASQMASSFTLQILCRTTITSSTIKFVFGLMYDVSFCTAMLAIKNGYFGLERSNGQFMTTVAINDDEWHMLTATYNGTELRLYVDGNIIEPIYVVELTIPEVATIRVGNWNGDINDFCFVGNIANCCIYNRALTDSEVMQNWQTDIRRYGISN